VAKDHSLGKGTTSGGKKRQKLMKKNKDSEIETMAKVQTITGHGPQHNGGSSYSFHREDARRIGKRRKNGGRGSKRTITIFFTRAG